MAEIRDELKLDIDDAIASIDRLEAQLGRFDVPVDFDVDDRAIRALRRDLDEVADVDFDVDVSDFESLDDRLDSIERNTGDITTEIGRLENAASDTEVSFRGVADALGISEREAAALSQELLDSERRANDAEAAARDLAQQLGLSEREADQFADAMRRGANQVDDAADRAGRLRAGLGALAGVIAGIGVFQIVRQGVDQAVTSLESFSNQRESINAVQVVFEEAADTIFEFGETAARSAGLAESSFNQLVVPIGSLLRNFGFDAEEAADASVVLTQRAADLASVFNTDVTEALGAVQAALRGEGDPIERFGANVSAARVEAFALAEGLASTKGEIDDAVKVQARLGLILRDTARVQGDFANTSTEAANAQRVLAAEAENARATIGEALLPTLESLLDVAPDLINQLEDLAPAIAAMGGAFVEALPAVVGVAEALITFAGRIPAAISVLDNAGDAVATGFIQGLVNVGQTIPVIGELFDELGKQVDESVGTSKERIDDLQTSLAELDLITSIQAGIPATAAFTGVIQNLARETESIEGSFERFARIAQLTNTELEFVTQGFIDTADQAGLTAEEVEYLEGVLFRLPDSFDEAETNRFRRQLGEAADAVQRLSEESENAPSTLGLLGQIADETGVSMAALLTSTDPVVASLIDMLTPTQRARIALDGFATGAIDAADAIRDELEGALLGLPGVFETVGDEVQASGQTVIDNFQTQATDIINFNANLLTILAQGNTAVFAELRAQGAAEAGAAAADFADNYDLATEFENALRLQTPELAALLDDAFFTAAELANMDAASRETIEKFATELEDGPLKDRIFDALQGAINIAAAREFAELNINVPLRITPTGVILSGSADTLEQRINDTNTGGSLPNSDITGTRATVEFNTTINNPTSQNVEEEAATLQQQVGTAAALLD